MDAWMDGWMDGLMDGWMDGRTGGQINNYRRVAFEHSVETLLYVTKTCQCKIRRDFIRCKK